MLVNDIANRVDVSLENAVSRWVGDHQCRQRLGMIGSFGVVGQLTMTYSYRYAEASLVAPLDYLTILLTLIGIAVGIGTVTLLRDQMAWPWYVLVGATVTFVTGLIAGAFESGRPAPVPE